MPSTPWVLPSGMKGDPEFVRVGPSMAGEDEYTCPARVAAKARPAVAPATWPGWPKPSLEQFALGPVKTLLDRIEFDGLSIDDALSGPIQAEKPIHPGLDSFTRHAVAKYLSVGHQGLIPVEEYWVRQWQSEESRLFREVYAWGRRYQSPDEGTREFRFLCHGSAGARPRDDAAVAVAAYSAAFGVPAPWPAPWRSRFIPTGPRAAVQRVRIFEVGLLDGSCQPLFEGTSEQALHLFETEGLGEIRRIVAGGLPVAGSSCADCKVLTACPTPRKAPGLLGIRPGRGPIRKVSVSDLRYHRDCPAQMHMRSTLHLPKTGEYGPDAVRGQAIHHVLESNHLNAAKVPCSALDVAVDERGWSAGDFTVDDEQARLGAQMLSHHPDECPLASALGVEEVLVEPNLAFWDTAANAIVLAKPDLLYRERDSWIWRETKSTEKEHWYHDDLLEEFPQLALGLLILSRGLLDGDLAGSRVELEVLRPGRAETYAEDPADPERVAKAAQVIVAMAEPWHADRLYPTKASEWVCQRCPVSLWCPDYEGGESPPILQFDGGLDD